MQFYLFFDIIEIADKARSNLTCYFSMSVSKFSIFKWEFWCKEKKKPAHSC